MTDSQQAAAEGKVIKHLTYILHSQNPLFNVLRVVCAESRAPGASDKSELVNISGRTTTVNGINHFVSIEIVNKENEIRVHSIPEDKVESRLSLLHTRNRFPPPPEKGPILYY